MLDHLIRAATLVDGTGAPARVADLGIRNGRVVEIGRISEGARRTTEAAGLVACPGFVDPHTHYDAQLFWDPEGSPSNLHGVTSVIAGNCSFALAPLRARDADFTRRMLARVEGMPLAALERGVPWNWESFGDYLEALEGRIGPNAGFIAGHSALRRYVLGAAAHSSAAEGDALDRMRAELAAALAAGALGLSTDISLAHTDGDGRPIPARGASAEEHLALSEVVGRHPGTFLSGIFQGGSDGWSPFELEHLSRMSALANRVLNWNLLVVDAAHPERAQQQLSLSQHARARGGRVVALLMPTIVPMTLSLGSYCALFLIPGWREVMALPLAERIRALANPETRRRMQRAANSEEAGMFRRLGDFGGYTIGETSSPENRALEGRVVREIARERGLDPFDALVEIAIRDELCTVLWPSAPDDDDAHWALRAGIWHDPDVLLAGSDAGAHLDRMCGAAYPTQFIADCLRGRKLMGLEQAIHALTDKPARLFGLRDRGRLAKGAFADLVLFDPDAIGSGPARLVRDLPGGSARLVADSRGVQRVFVAGVETLRDGRATGALPGRVLRSGRDTETVPARA